MNDEKLALMGGSPVISDPFPPYKSMGGEEVEAVSQVVRSGRLSGYVGAKGDGFMGGPQVRELEVEAAEYFGVENCIAVNSWTSGLSCAVGSLALEPGDEVITSPWTMAATASAIVQWNAIPVFADIDPRTFNLDPGAVEHRITSRTRAIMIPDIFGQSANIEAFRHIADNFDLTLISDTAQSPGAQRSASYAGTMADIGGFSLNYHKHISCGEGGLIVTDDDDLAFRMALIRNHGEVLLGQGVTVDPPFGILGRNYRMGEMEAAIARCQLHKLSDRVQTRQDAAERLSNVLRKLPGLEIPYIDPLNSHVYYVYPLILSDELREHRSTIVSALRSEGVPGLAEGYQNLHKLPLFARHQAFGRDGFPYKSGDFTSTAACPVAEEYHERAFFGILLCAHEFTIEETSLMVNAFQKVWDNLDALVG